MGETEGRPENLEDWVRKLNDLRMPVVARTVQEISKIVSDRNSSAAQLSRIVMSDASMSARVLRIANSSFHRTGGGSICTVSRAVVKLGFETIRSITRSVSVIEALLKGERRERVLKEMAHAFHAASQAQSLAEKSNPESAEDVFVAALLYRIGNMGFWCLPGDMTKKLESALEENPTADPAEIEKKVLGFTLHKLTTKLSDEWALGETLKSALQNTDDPDLITAHITLGHQVADAVENGWDSESVAELSKEISEKFLISPEGVQSMIDHNMGLAVDNAMAYGASEVADMIPLPKSRLRNHDGADGEGSRGETEAQYFEPDPKLQLEFLRELATVVEEKPDINDLLDMILEGIHRGIGMDRTLFALLTPDKKYLKAKHALGQGQDQLMKQFVFAMQPELGQEVLFSRQLKIQHALLIPSDPPEQLLPLLQDSLLDITGRRGFYSAPIIVNNYSIGLFYADRLPSGRELDQESYDSFKHFAQQAGLGLTAISQRRQS